MIENIYKICDSFAKYLYYLFEFPLTEQKKI